MLCHHGWINEADKKKEKELRRAKGKAKKDDKVQEDNEEDDKKVYYCACLTVCLHISDTLAIFMFHC